MPENEHGTWPDYTCPACGTVDATMTMEDGSVHCLVCGAVE